MAIRGSNSALRVIEKPPGLTPAVRWQSATVTSIVMRTPRITSFVFELSRPFSFEAGQHVDIRLTAPNGYRAMRSYSIASEPGESSSIELAIERLENGEVSQFFHEVVVVGDTIELRGPLGGYFVWSEKDGGPLLLAGGGSGVVPLVSMIMRCQRVAADLPVLLLFSARSWDEVLFRDELFGFEQKRNGFSLVLALTREPQRRPTDFARRVDAGIMADVLRRLPAAPKYVYVCGSNAFVNSAADGAVAAGVQAPRIRTERYGV
jgi:ferredoxin-NADP reductase